MRGIMAWQGAFPGFEKRNKVRFLTRKQTVPLTCTLGSANHRFTARNLPAGTAVFHFPRCEAVWVHDSPWARIAFADKDHAWFQLQRSVEPRHGVRGAGSYLDLN